MRDKKHPSHPETPVYKGISEEKVRDEGGILLLPFTGVMPVNGRSSNSFGIYDFQK